jgi:hypothetical protein
VRQDVLPWPRDGSRRSGSPPGTYFFASAVWTRDGSSAWVVANEDGGEWATDVRPSTTPRREGTLLPLNDEASRDSNGVAIPPSRSVLRRFPQLSSGLAILSSCLG